MGAAHDSLTRLRAWWFRRQGLTGGKARTLASCLRQAGWLPVSGSTGIYLSMRARMPGVSRQAIDRAALDGTDIIEVPGAHARPSVMVPRGEMALALRLHWASYQKHAAPLFATGRLSRDGLKGVEAQACRALDEGPLPMGEIRARVTHPDAGELLMGALVYLTVRGVVRRYPVDGRLDDSKYIYELQHSDDRPDLEAEGDEATVVASATRLFLQRHGPATVDEIASWASVTKGAVRRALAVLRGERISIAGWSDDAWLLPEDLRPWRTFAGESGGRIVFLPYRDPFVWVRRPPAVLAARNSVPALNTDLKRVALRDLDALNHHALVSDGELVGLWEYDPAAGRIVARVWSTDRRLRRRIADSASDVERFIHQQIGDAKRSAVDPPARRARRIAFCRQ